MSFSKRDAYGLALTLLLVGELELLVVNNYEIRTAVRELVAMPIYHIVLTFIVLCALISKFDRRLLMTTGADLRVSKPALAAHSMLFALIYLKLPTLWAFSTGLPGAIQPVFWLALGGLLLASWLLISLPLQLWKGLYVPFKRYGPFLVTASTLTPYLSQLTSNWWSAFTALTFYFVDLGLEFLLQDSIVAPQQSVVGTSHFVVRILPGCSGFEGMGLITVLLASYLWIKGSEKPLKSYWWLFPVGLILMWLSNIVRLIVLVTIGSYLSPDIAMKGFHSQAGWLFFTLVSLILIAWVENHEMKRRAMLADYPGLLLLIPLLSAIVGTMVCAAFTDDFNYSYPFKVLLIILGLLISPSLLPSLWTKPSWLTSVIVGLAVFVVWRALSPSIPSPSPFDRLAEPLAYGWLVCRLLGSIALIPLVEEIAFRAYLLRRLQSRDFRSISPHSLTPVSLVTSSMAFGLLHQNWLAGSLAGFAYAICYARLGGLGSAVVAHSTTNLCLCLEAILVGHWWLLQ